MSINTQKRPSRNVTALAAAVTRAPRALTARTVSVTQRIPVKTLTKSFGMGMPRNTPRNMHTNTDVFASLR